MRMKKGTILGLMSMVFSSTMDDGIGVFGENKPNVIVKKEIKKVIPKGLKRFDYGSEHLYASNKKVADKKAIKRGWLCNNI